MKIEHVSYEEVECSECGRVGSPNTIIWLDHLCKHFIAFCVDCYPKFVELILDIDLEKLEYLIDEAIGEYVFHIPPKRLKQILKEVI